MKQFSGYTIRTLLDEPFTVFLRLFELATRAQADDALEHTYSAIISALNGGGDSLQFRRGDVYLLDKESKIELTDDEIAQAKKLAEEYIKNGGVVIEKITLGDLKQNV